MTERLHFHFSLSCIGEGNGNPLQCSFLENPRDGGAWWAAIYGVAQSGTRLERLSSSSSNSNLSNGIFLKKRRNMELQEGEGGLVLRSFQIPDYSHQEELINGRGQNFGTHT